MDTLANLWQFILNNQNKLLEQTFEHIGLTFLSLLLAVIISVPLGILITRQKKLAAPVLAFANLMQTIPSMALLGFMLPVLGIGLKPAIIALFLYSLLPIIRNTYAGIQEVDDAVIEAARGMGLTPRQILLQVELPLAMPVIFAGIRTATVINVGLATLAAYIGAGGLGEFIFGGIALNNSEMILAGAIPSALLAIIFDILLGRLQKMRLRQVYRRVGTLGLIGILLAGLNLAPSWYGQRWTAGFEPEFIGRADGYKHLASTYGLNFNTAVLNAGLMYGAVKEGHIDVISGYSTDGRIKAFNLRVLEDDRHAFPPYHCAPLIHSALRQERPEVVDALNLLSGLISDSVMTGLNYAVDYLKESPKVVAERFLKENGLWKPDQKQGGDIFIIGSKIFTEQYILTELYAQLINGYTDMDTDIKPGLGGTKICFEALRQREIDLYPEYTGTGLMVLLSPPEEIVNDMITDPDAVYDYVAKECLDQFELEWLDPIGFNNTYALMMRQDKAKKYDINKISDLAN